MKLFHKTLKLYLIFSVVISIISVPVFYFLIQDLWIKDVDESLIYQREDIVKGLKVKTLDSTKVLDLDFVENSKRFDMGVYVFQSQKFHPTTDSLYNISYFDSTRQHVEPFRELISFVTVNGTSYKIIVRKDLVESADLIRGISVTQAILFLILITGILILNSYFSRKIWQPFYTTVSELKLFRIDKQKPIAAPKTNILEFNELGAAIQGLTENNIRTFKAQKEFTENAAHETQTPLAVIKNQVDLLLQDKKLTREQAEIIERMDKNIRYLSSLNRNLVLLAKIDNDQFNITEKVNLTQTLKDALDIFEEECRLKGIQLKVKIASRIQIQSNAHLLQLLFLNLIKNATKHNISGGMITLELNDEFFRIINTGKNEPLPVDDIFKRFYKKGGQNDSMGLGLAIAKRICELLKLNLSYHFEASNKHLFTVHYGKE